MMNLRPPTLLGIVFAAAAGVAVGQELAEPVSDGGIQIGWVSNAFGTNYMADGTTTFEQAFADDGTKIYFQLGTFSTGFDPHTASQADWVANWSFLQQVEYDTAEGQVVGTATLESNNSPFDLNGQAYIWGFTSTNVTPESQWILLAAPSWKWPDKDGSVAPIFSVGDLDAYAITGSVNPSGSPYHMQLSYVMVPEPSTPLLAVTAALGLAWRRRR